MARKSRKNPLSPSPAAGRTSNPLRTAFYIRLSVEDNQGRGNSIDNQQLVLRDYIADRPEFLLTQTYIDNGLTGTNYNRPAFQRMLADIEAGAIECVMVKDLSRLGRNFIDTGYYIEQYFFAHHIRFIAVTDQFDTADADQRHGGIMLPLKNMINEAYALDIGRKIRAQQHQAMLDGKFVGARPPYGYLKDPQDCHHLVPDPETAPVVRQIFAWAEERVAVNEIVRRLNAQGIPTPSHAQKEKGILTDALVGGPYWQSRTVLKILGSEVYMGDLVQGKSQTVDHRQRRAAEEHRITVQNTHEALIDRETFARVRQIRAEIAEETKAGRSGHFTPNLFVGKVFCAHCGRALHRQWSERKTMPDRYTFHCLTNNRYRRGTCPGVCMEERKLMGVVTDFLIRAVNLELGKSVAALQEASAQETEEETIRKEIAAKRRELEQNRKFLRGLFEHLVQHMITQEEYQTMKEDYDARAALLTDALDGLTNRQKRFREQETRKAELTSDAAYLAAHHELTRDLIERLIERIEITHEHEVSIVCSFADTFSKEGKR